MLITLFSLKLATFVAIQLPNLHCVDTEEVGETELLLNRQLFPYTVHTNTYAM